MVEFKFRDDPDLPFLVMDFPGTPITLEDMDGFQQVVKSRIGTGRPKLVFNLELVEDVHPDVAEVIIAGFNAFKIRGLSIRVLNPTRRVARLLRLESLSNNEVHFSMEAVVISFRGLVATC